MSWKTVARVTPVLVAIISILPVGCSSASSTWTGSVDAVFRYRQKENSTLVHEVRASSFSEKAGLKAGDLVLAVDGDDVSNVSYEVVRAALRGPIGSVAVLTVKRGEETLEIEVERRLIKDSKKKKEKD